mgnify:CR=1 FL=1
MEDLKIATIIVMTVTSFVSILQFVHSLKKRKDDLFRLRYQFFERLSKVWLETHHLENNTLDKVDLIPIVTEANFLFGNDITKHIYTLENKRASNGLFLEDDFCKPFKKYLKL